MGSKRRRAPAARMQVCACLACFVFVAQALAFFMPQASAPAAPPPKPPKPPVLLPAEHGADASEPIAAESRPIRRSVARPGSIPKLIHQSWRDGGFPKTIFNWRWQQGLLDLNPGWELRKWTDESSRELIAREYDWFLPTYDAYPSYIQRCDASRYFILHHYGGVYADLDIECTKPFGPVLGTHRAIFSYKQGSDMSRGLVNAIFASEARHPIWTTVFDLLLNRSAAGAAASTHVDVVRSTGPGLLRDAVLQLRRDGALQQLGIVLLDSGVWHPLMPEQKRGRDATEATAAALAASSCNHHFVSSWMHHDKEKHGSTETARGAKAASMRADGAGGADGAPKAAIGRTGVVPVGQGFRTVNPWRSYQLGGGGDGGGGGGAKGGGGGRGGSPSANKPGRGGPGRAKKGGKFPFKRGGQRRGVH